MSSCLFDLQPLAEPSVPSPETEQRQELARLQARNAQELERIQARNVELMAKSAELQHRQLRLQRRVFAMERRRVLHEVTHLVNRDAVARNYIMRAQGISVSLFFSRPNYRIFSHILLPFP